MCMSSTDGKAHLCGANETETPWVPTNQMIKRWYGNGKRRVAVHCCERWEQPRNTECRWVTAYGGYIGEHEFRCAPRRGCNRHLGYRRTAHLRDLHA